MSSNSRTAISAELGLGLVGPEHTIVPLMASLYYSCQDPYAASLHSREGIGDVRAWPSAASEQGPKTLFLARTYELVPDGDEPEYMDFDAELTELLSQA